MPNFQRQLRWEADDRRMLLQSVLQGIPIGNLLLWRRPADAGTLKMADRSIEVARRDDALWIVDGQQRVDALFGMLADGGSSTPGTPSAGYRFGLDADTGKVVSEPPSGRPLPRHLPVSKLLDPVELQMWCIARGLQSDDMRRVLAVGEAVRSYPVPQYIVETDSESALREVFARINSTGKRMEEFEIFVALHPGAGQTGTALEVLAKVCRDAEFGPIPRDWLLKIVEALATTRPSRKRMRHREAAPDPTWNRRFRRCSGTRRGQSSARNSRPDPSSSPALPTPAPRWQFYWPKVPGTQSYPIGFRPPPRSSGRVWSTSPCCWYPEIAHRRPTDSSSLHRRITRHSSRRSRIGRPGRTPKTWRF